MQGAPITITRQPGTEATVRLAVGAANILGLSADHRAKATVFFGRRSARVTVLSDASLPAGNAVVTDAAANVLLLPEQLELSLYRLSANRFRLGPLIALLVSRHTLRAALNGGGDDLLFRRYNRYAAEIGAVFVLCTPEDLDFARGAAEVYRLAASGWQRWRAPLPRVMYDRCFGVKGRKLAEALRPIASSKGVTIINKPVKITKLACYQVVRADPELRGIVPHSAPLTLPALRLAARRFRALFVKPDNLSKGQGVYRLKWRKSAWVMERNDSSGRQQVVCERLTDVLQQLPGEQPYLLQEALDLATYRGNSYDFRVLVQKDAGQAWQVTGAVARIAPRNGVITSPRSGGNVMPANHVLQHSFGAVKGNELLAVLQATALRLADCVERAYGLCAELGLDLGITKSGEIRLIEVNGKPLKVSLSRLRDPAISGRMYRQPILYAASLDLQLPSLGARKTAVGKANARVRPKAADKVPPVASPKPGREAAPRGRPRMRHGRARSAAQDGTTESRLK